MTITKSLFTIVLVSSSLITIDAQSLDQNLVSSASGHSSTTNLNYEHTIGQVVQGVQELTTGSLTEGFHQPALLLTDVQHLKPDIAVNIYPNPTTDQLTISTMSHQNSSYRLVNAAGMIIASGRLTSADTSVPMAHTPPGAYYLTVLNEALIVSTAKIIKQ